MFSPSMSTVSSDPIQLIRVGELRQRRWEFQRGPEAWNISYHSNAEEGWGFGGYGDEGLAEGG